MGRAVLILRSPEDRKKAHQWVDKAPWGTRTEWKASKRSLPQNDRMWAMLTEVAGQVLWHGVRLTPADWKLIFMDGLKKEMRMVPNFEGNGFLSLGRSSSDLTVEEMTDMIELIFAFGANHGVVFQEKVAA